MKRLLLIVFLASFVNCLSFSQGTLKGKLIDSTAKTPLGYATVTVFKATDTAMVTYRLSTPDGDFKVPGLPFDVNCRVVISYTGFGIYRKEFIINANQATIDLGAIYMLRDSRSLDEILVYAERPPVVFKKDTIEFNASAFKTLPNALVEDLLKKLPGVQVDRDGNINVNGKPVNRILVDGKTFFGNDPKMATRNLPANIIDKVQVMDDQEELLRNGDDNLNNVGKVVNITLKKGVKKGWFGKIYGGAGTDKLYEAGGIANMYRDTLQLSVLGYMNNMNKSGFSFSELMQAGGLERTGSNLAGRNISIWNNSSGGSGVSINGVNFGGAQNYGGIATSKGVGFNLNHAPNTKRSFYAQYFYGHINIDRFTQTDINQYNADTIVNNNTRLTGDVMTYGHNIGIGERLKPDSVTNILINANYMIGYQDEDRISNISTMNNKLGKLSYGNVTQLNLANTYNYRHSMNITRLSKTKAGRRFTLGHNLDVNNRFNDYSTESGISYLYPLRFDSVSSQLRKERIPRTDANVTFNYIEPLSKKFIFRIGGRYEYSKLGNSINTFNKNSSTKEYDVFNTLLSSDFKRVSNRYMVTPGIEIKWKGMSITPSVRALLQYADNRLVSPPASIKLKQADLLPALTVVYKQLNFNYNKDVILPSYTYLIPVRDNTNPYFIYRGNAGLVPHEKNGFSLNYNFNNPKKNFNASVYANGSFTQNDIVQSITVDDKGVQTIMPVNADGSSSFYINFNLYRQYKNNPRFIYSWNAGGNYNFNRNRFLYNNESSWQTNFNLNSWVGINLNWNDKFEWNSSYSLGYNFGHYTNPAFQKLKIVYQNWDNELVLRWPKHVIWETQVSYSYNSKTPAGTPKDIVRWNAALNFTMLKDETGVLKLNVFDILNTNVNTSSFVNRNMITTSQTNNLSQYFMATFTYNIRAAGAKKKVGGRERLFFF